MVHLVAASRGLHRDYNASGWDFQRAAAAGDPHPRAPRPGWGFRLGKTQFSRHRLLPGGDFAGA